MRVIVAGGRDFSNYDLLRERLDYYLSRTGEPVEIVSGTARGADQLGERYAKERGLPVASFPADWNRFGKAAGYKRNSEMASYATHLVAFWDGESRGTKHMINLAERHNLVVRVVPYSDKSL